MNTPRNPTTDLKRGKGGSEAGGQHEGLRHPTTDDRQVEQRLDDVGLEDQGDVLEDDLRDRRSKGTPGADERRNDDTRKQRH